MPEIKIQHVVSCSSEDSVHRASNLLNSETFRKWKCATAGEKQASIILQLEKSSKIHSIDIGNESSAFVEVLVGHSTSDNPEDYQVIVVTSSFMNPIESKNGTNGNRVRIFGSDKLCKATLGKHWDRVKIVCTQPFNKHISYGLSFIKLHSPPSEADATSPPAQKVFGKFALREDSSSSQLSSGSFFKERHKTKEEPAPLKGAAAIRAASYKTKTESAGESSLGVKKTHAPAKPSTIVREEKKETPKQAEVKQATKRKFSQDDDDDDDGTSSSSKEKVKKKHVEEKREEPKKKLIEIMSGVTFVLSGYQNPYRGELRDKALRMGAKYEANWGPGCTHLICAFINTPKYQQVRGKGKIVSKEWILDSYKKKFLQPWQRYKLSQDGDSSSSEEDDEEEESDEEVVKPSARGRTGPPTKVAKQPKKKVQEDQQQASKMSKPSDEEKDEKPKPKVQESPVKKKPSDEEEFAGSTDVESIGEGEPGISGLASDADTEDELNQLQEEKTVKVEDPFGASTDEEDDDVPSKATSNGSDISWERIPKLPDFFEKEHFLFYGKLSAEERRQLRRFVIAFGGREENYMNETVDYVITDSKWDRNFDEALKENKSLLFVSPKWLHVCNEAGEKVSHAAYEITKAA